MGKVDDMRAWNEWREYYRALKRDKAVDSLSPVERKQRLEKLEKDPVAWMLFFFAEYARYPFTPFQKRAIRRITSNPEWYEVLSWSRELAKSTIVFMCIMYLVLTKRKRNVLLVSNSHENATRLLEPYKKAFEQNALLKAYYGDLREAGNWTADEFSLTSGAAFRALGALESPRGTRKDAFRPDTILPDDFDTDADCRNPDIVKKKWQWFEEALIPTRSVSGDLLVVFCGNVIAKDCCVTRAGAKADHWDIVNIRNAEGRSTWPEKNSEERIRRIEQTISTKAFQQEYMNNPLSEGEVIKEVVWGKCPPLARLQFAVAYADPAPSNARNKASSFKANSCSATATGSSMSTRASSTTSPTTSSWSGSTTCVTMRASGCRSITSSRTTRCRIPFTSRCSFRCSRRTPVNGDSSASRPTCGANRRNSSVSRATLNR